MGQSAKAIVQFSLLILVMASIGVWVSEVNWGWKIGLPVAAIGMAYVLFWANHREDQAPDVLGELTDVYMERLGLCFAFIPTVNDDCCVMQFYFQNRYANPCSAEVVLRHCTFLPKHQSKKLSTIALRIECAGGECGVRFVPFAIPQKYQGSSQIFDVAANVKYPNRRGKLLRFREGVHVGSLPFPSLGGLAQTPARCELPLPSNVAETVAKDSKSAVQTIWRPEE